MPLSIFRQQGPNGAPRDVSPLEPLRNDIVESLSARLAPGQTHVSTFHLWPSAECPVGCGHCNYALPMSLTRVTRCSVGGDPAPLVPSPPLGHPDGDRLEPGGQHGGLSWCLQTRLACRAACGRMHSLSPRGSRPRSCLLSVIPPSATEERTQSHLCHRSGRD